MKNSPNRIGLAMAVSLTIVLIAATGCTREEGPQVDDPLTEDTAVITTAQTAETPEVAIGTTVAVALEDKRIAVAPTLPPGPVIFTIANSGTELHSFAIEGEDIARSLDSNLESGQSDTLEVILREGTYTAFCPILQHRDEGESVEINVAP